MDVDDAAAAARHVKVVEFLSTNPYAQGRGIKVALRSKYTPTVRRMMASPQHLPRGP
jgi:hypothetical protein